MKLNSSMCSWDNCITQTPCSWQVMQEYLPQQLLQRYKKMFNEYDSASTGVISIASVAAIMSECGYEYSVEYTNGILRNMNCCQSGHNFVDFSEFLVIMSASAKKCIIPEDEMLKIFRIFDQDGDGFIGREELKSLLSKLGDEISEEEVEEMIREADRDGDGLVSYQEFVRTITNSMDNNLLETESNNNIPKSTKACFYQPLNDLEDEEGNQRRLSEISGISEDPFSGFDTDDNCFQSQYSIDKIGEKKKKRFVKGSLRSSISWLTRITSRSSLNSSSSCKFEEENDNFMGKNMTFPRRKQYQSCEDIVGPFSNKREKNTKKNFSVENLLSLTSSRRKKRNFSTADIL